VNFFVHTQSQLNPHSPKPVTVNMKERKRSCHSVFLALLIGACLQILASGVQADLKLLPAEEHAELYPDTMLYTIRRKGKKIGTHTVSFRRGTKGLSVDVESKIKVTIMRVPVYRFNYVANEYWEDGTLRSINATTNSNGEETTVTFIPESAIQSSNHWNAAVLDSSSIYNTITGNISAVSIERIGDVNLSSGDESIAATHYRYTGDIQAETWYDTKNRWVKLQFKGEDGSVITYTADPLEIRP